jgi:hypothetical protein
VAGRVPLRKEDKVARKVVSIAHLRHLLAAREKDRAGRFRQDAFIVKVERETAPADTAVPK